MPKNDATIQAALEAKPELARACFRALSRQAEGKLLFAGPTLVQAEREQLGGETTCEGIDVLMTLEHGPKSPREFAILSALSTRGLALSDPDASKIARFCAHATWLGMNTHYDLFQFVPDLAPEQADSIWAELQTRSASSGSLTPKERALITFMKAILARDQGPQERAAAEASLSLDGASLIGEEVPKPPRAGAAFLSWITGFSLLRWLLRGLAWLVGYRQKSELRVGAEALTLARSDRWFGRALRERAVSIPLRQISAVAVEQTWRTLPLVGGALALALGVVLGGVLIFEGAWSGETVLLTLGAALILAGAGLDLALGLFLPHREGKSVLVVEAEGAYMRMIAQSRQEAEQIKAAIGDRT